MKTNKKHLISNPKYRISSYLPFTRNAIQTLLSYRSNILFYFIGNILKIFVFFFLWKAIFASSGEEILRGFSFPDMVIYLILTNFIYELSGNVGSEMHEEISSGQISMSLIKPISFRFRIYFTSLGDTIYSFMMSGVPSLVATYIIAYIYGISSQLTIGNLFLFLLSLILSLIVRMSYTFIVSLLGFVTTNMFGVWQVNNAVVRLCSGAIIPLTFFPGVIRKIFEFLPFSSFISTPLNIFLGKFSNIELLKAFGLQIFWILLFNLFGNFVWKKVIKHLIIQGG